jgi:hypothetical protein
MVSTHQAAFLPFTTSWFATQKDRLTSRAAPTEAGEAKALQAKVAILCRRELRFRTLVGAWMSERIIPIGPHPKGRLLHLYTGRTDDALRSCDRSWPKTKFIATIRKMVTDKITEIDVGSLPPFWKGNDHFAISRFSLSLICIFIRMLNHLVPY